MNKNLLIKQNNELFNKIGVLTADNSALKNKISELNLSIADYKNKISALEIELEKLKSNIQNPVTLTENSESKTENNTLPITAELAAEPVEVSDEIEYASQIIGDIVIKAVGCIDYISSNEKSNKKELINLILGRTEVAKAEILNIISSDVGETAKRDLINTQYAEAEEYFKSISEQ